MYNTYINISPNIYSHGTPPFWLVPLESICIEKLKKKKRASCRTLHRTSWFIREMTVRTDRQTDRQTDRKKQTLRTTDRQAVRTTTDSEDARQADRQCVQQTDRQKGSESNRRE